MDGISVQQLVRSGKGAGGQPVTWVSSDLSKTRRQQLLLWSEDEVFRAETGSALVCVLVLLWVAREDLGSKRGKL